MNFYHSYIPENNNQTKSTSISLKNSAKVLNSIYNYTQNSEGLLLENSDEEIFFDSKSTKSSRTDLTESDKETECASVRGGESYYPLSASASLGKIAFDCPEYGFQRNALSETDMRVYTPTAILDEILPEDDWDNKSDDDEETRESLGSEWDEDDGNNSLENFNEYWETDNTTDDSDDYNYGDDDFCDDDCSGRRYDCTQEEWDQALKKLNLFRKRVTKFQTTEKDGTRSVGVCANGLKTFVDIYHLVCFRNEEEDDNTPSEPIDEAIRYSPDQQTIDPKDITVLVAAFCQDLTGFKDIGIFSKLTEFICDNSCLEQSDLAWSDLEDLKDLKKLSLDNSRLNYIKPLCLQSLTSLSVADNFIKSLEFLRCDQLRNLRELNLGNNEITYLPEDIMLNVGKLEILVLSGNPLCAVNDIKALKCCNNLGRLYLSDQMWGDCPVMGVVNIRTIAINIFPSISSLNGRSIYDTDKSSAAAYMTVRAARCYAQTVSIGTHHSHLRQQNRKNTMQKLENISKRILRVVNILSKYRRVMETENISTCPAISDVIRNTISQLDNHLTRLKKWAHVGTTRLETATQISYWEEEVEKWSKWVEYVSHASTKCKLGLCVLGETSEASSYLVAMINQLVSDLACKPGPSKSMKVETIFSFRDNCMSAGTNMYCRKHIEHDDALDYIEAPLESYFVDEEAGSYFNEDPDVPSFVKPDYSAPSSGYPGLLSSPSHRLLFLMTPMENKDNPLVYLNNVLTGVSRHKEKEIRLTNCLWTAIQGSAGHCKWRSMKPFNVVTIVKVLEDCLHIITTSNTEKKPCTIYGIGTPLAITVAYLVGMSLFQDLHNDSWWTENNEDEDVLLATEIALNSVYNSEDYPLQAHLKITANSMLHRSVHPLSSYVKNIKDETHADLAAICNETGDSNDLQKSTSAFLDVSESGELFFPPISKLLGAPTAKILTSLDVSGNNIEFFSGFIDLENLKILNISHNKLTTLAGINKLPQLEHLILCCNYLRTLISNIAFLAWAAPQLQFLEVLPNPFQDIRDIQHIPVLLTTALPKLMRIDLWQFPFQPPISFSTILPPNIAEASLSQAVLAKSGMDTCYIFDSLCSRCLTNVDNLPEEPPFPAECSTTGTGMDLNLSNNYITSISLTKCSFTTNEEWRITLVKLQLQSNLISNLRWMRDIVFPNLQILNLSDNYLENVAELGKSCPQLRHLYLSHNPLPCLASILEPLRSLVHLCVLDCSGSPLAQDLSYAEHLANIFQRTRVFDGLKHSRKSHADWEAVAKSFGTDINNIFVVPT